jgi:hypothetical protein
LDVAQPFDYESKKSEDLEKNSLLKIDIVGFGNFGQFLAKTLIKQGHTILPHSRIDHRLLERWEFLSSRMQMIFVKSILRLYCYVHLL